jgi:hypothetical protein
MNWCFAINGPKVAALLLTMIVHILFCLIGDLFSPSSTITRKGVLLGFISFVVLTLGQAEIATATNSVALTVTHPVAGETVSGTYTFAVSAAWSYPRIEFKLGSKRIGLLTSEGSATKRPRLQLSVSWNTGYASDGSYALQVLGEDSTGHVWTTAEQLFTINNYGDSLVVLSPDLTKSLSGKVSINMTGADSQYYPAYWMLNIDGDFIAAQFTDEVGRSVVNTAEQIDTTRFLNGKHELYIGLHSDFWPGGVWPPNSPSSITYNSWRGGFERVVTINNGHTLMDVTANYLHVYLGPGTQATLTCKLLFTDNTTGDCVSPVYTSSDATVATVSSSGAVVAGAQDGYTTVTLTDSGKSTDVHVWVRSNPGIPHFSGSGQMLDTYTPGSSLFVIAPLLLDPYWMESDPTLTAAAHEAGVNTLQSGIYPNPRSLTYDYATWQQYYDTAFLTRWQWAASNRFHILATGDDIARNIGQEGWWTMNWPPAKTAVQYAFQRLAESGVGIAVDMIDEGSMLWGFTPTPPGLVGGPSSFQAITCSGTTCTVDWPNNPVNSSRFGSGSDFALDGSLNSSLNTPGGKMFSATNIGKDSFDFVPASPIAGTFTSANDPGLEFLWWAGDFYGCASQPCDPPVPNDALVRIASWVREIQPTVPISWPALSLSPPESQGAWMGKNSISDYASHYWTSLQGRPTYAWSSGIVEESNAMRSAFYSRQGLMMLDRPQLLLSSISGPFYMKETPGGGSYAPPADSLYLPGVNDGTVTSLIMTAAALGAAGVRLYQFDTAGNAGGRASAPLGSVFQTGASPEGDLIGQGIWRAMGSAANALTGVLQPYILGAALSSPAMGRNIVTAARTSLAGTMLMVVNDNDFDRNLFVDLSPYTNGSPITRYLINYDGMQTSVLAPASGDLVSLSGGETAAYVFSKASTTKTEGHHPPKPLLRAIVR